MNTSGELQREIEGVLRKVLLIVEVLDRSWEKFKDSDNANRKNVEADIKRRINKLQRYKDQISSWIQSIEINDKKVNSLGSYHKGTTLIGAPHAEGIFVGADSAVFNLAGERIKPNQKKIFRLGGDPEFVPDHKYILFTGSGTGELVKMLKPFLSLNINHRHKTEGTVYTAKDCAEFSSSFLKNRTEYYGMELPDVDRLKVCNCSLIFGTFESDLVNAEQGDIPPALVNEEQGDIPPANEVFNPRNYFGSAEFINKRVHGLYMANKEGYYRKKKAFVIGAGKSKAQKVLKKRFRYDSSREDAVVALEEAMLMASKSGKSGGTVRIDLIDHNNHIERVSKKSISKLRKEHRERRDKDIVEEEVENGGNWQDFVKGLADEEDISDVTPHGLVEKDVAFDATPHPAKTATNKTITFPHIICENPSCGRTFNSEKALESHIKAKHSNGSHVPVAVSCHTCDRTFNSEKALESHIKAKHSNDSHEPVAVSGNISNRKFNLEKGLECHNKMKHPTSLNVGQCKKRSAVPTQSKIRAGKKAKLAPNQ